MTTATSSVALFAETEDARLCESVAELGARLGIRILTTLDNADLPDMLLVRTDERLELRVLQGEGIAGGKPVFAELDKIDTHSRGGASRKQPIYSALGLNSRNIPSTLLDATAGFGKDSWLAACKGLKVLAVERDPVVYALFEDALRRAGQSAPDVAERITPCFGDALDVLHKIAAGNLENGWFTPDVVYVDPMFPGADKRKTAEKKSMRVLRVLTGAEEGQAAMATAALDVARRVVVKLPAKAAPIFVDGPAPSVSHEGKGLRYDVYLRI